MLGGWFVWRCTFSELLFPPQGCLDLCACTRLSVSPLSDAEPPYAHVVICELLPAFLIPTGP